MIQPELPTPANDKYRPDIDGLRALAVLSVVLFHAFPKVVRGGYVGVDIFFVISGYLISSILFAEFAKNKFSLVGFYGRRIRRIFPALSLCLTAVLAYGFIGLMPSELAQLGKQVFFGAGFLSNIALWSESGYFDNAATVKPLLHLWSLGVEEQFYIVWPPLLWLATRLKAKMGRLLVGLFLASFAINIALSVSNISDDFYLPMSRFWELLAGAGLAWKGDVALSSKARSWLSAAGLVGLLGSVLLFYPAMRFPGWPALLPVAGAVAVILGGPETPVNRLVFSNRAAVSIGLISYPLYIWHWPLISYAYVVRLGKGPTPLMAAALVVGSVLLAWLTYRLVERPIRFGEHRHGHTQILAGAVALLGLFGLGIWMNGGFPQRYPALPGIDVTKISAASTDVIFQPTAGMDVVDHNKTLVAHLGQGERKVALSGDSLLFHYNPRVQQLADEGRLAANVFFVTGASCAPVPGLIQRDNFAHCREMPGLLSDLVARERVQTVVLGASWNGYASDYVWVERGGKRHSTATPEGVKAFYANLEDYVRSLQSMGARVYLVSGLPIHSRFDPHQMVSRTLTSFKIANDVGKEEPVANLRASNVGVDTYLRGVAERTGAGLQDPFPDICGKGDGCSPFFGAGEPKFVDNMHLRPIFVRQNLHFLDPLLTAEQ